MGLKVGEARGGRVLSPADGVRPGAHRSGLCDALSVTSGDGAAEEVEADNGPAGGVTAGAGGSTTSGEMRRDGTGGPSGSPVVRARGSSGWVCAEGKSRGPTPLLLFSSLGRRRGGGSRCRVRGVDGPNALRFTRFLGCGRVCGGFGVACVGVSACVCVHVFAFEGAT